MSGFDVRKLGLGHAIASAVFAKAAFARAVVACACACAIGLAALTALTATPVSAQLYSKGFEFLKAVEDRDGNAVTEMLDEPGTQIINTRDLKTGETGLHIVAKRQDALWVRFLLQRGADPNIRDKNGVYPLQISATLGDLDSVEALIGGGALLDIADSQGETPLISAVHKRDVALIIRLLKEGADPDRNDNSGRSARDYAELMTGNQQILDAFAAADADRENSGTPKQYGPSF